MVARIVAILVLVLGLATVVAATAMPAAALDIKCQSSNSGQCDLVKTNQKLENRVWGILQVAFGILGGIAVIMVIVGAFMFTTSAGDPGKVTNAKKTITYAIVGLAVAIFATAIIAVVVEYFV